MKSGLWKYWYKSGNLFSKGIFRNGLRTGVWIEWHENGNKKTQTIYRNGLKNGKEINWSLKEVKLSEFSFQVEVKMALLKNGLVLVLKNQLVILLKVKKMENF